MIGFSTMALPGWSWFDLSRPVAPDVKAASGQLVAEVPAEARKKVRAEAERSLTSALTDMAGRGVSAAYIATEKPIVANSSPMFAVLSPDFTVDGERLEPLDYMLGLLVSPGSTVIEPPGMVGVRQVTDKRDGPSIDQELAAVPPGLLDAADGQFSVGDVKDALAGAKRWHRELQYLIGVPDTDDRWMVVLATISVVEGKGARELMDLMTVVADQWVTAIKWNASADEPSAGE